MKTGKTVFSTEKNSAFSTSDSSIVMTYKVNF